jgi:hypothetical protein
VVASLRAAAAIFCVRRHDLGDLRIRLVEPGCTPCEGPPAFLLFLGQLDLLGEGELLGVGALLRLLFFSAFASSATATADSRTARQRADSRVAASLTGRTSGLGGKRRPARTRCRRPVL